MADVKISELTALTTPDGAEELVVNDSGTTKKITIEDLFAGDNVKAKFGAGDDLQIYHDGSNSYVSDVGTGNLVLRGANIEMYDGAGDTLMFNANNNGGVGLHYAGATKLTTTSTGVDVAGTVTSDGLVSVNSTDTQGKFSGWSATTGALTHSGAIELGQNAAYQGVVSYDATGATRVVFDNTYGSVGSTFEFRTNTSATPKTHLKVSGSGDISFYEDTGTTPKFFWDASAESLGIGTSSPNHELQLNASDTTSTLQMTNSTTSYGGADGTHLIASGLDFIINNREAQNVRIKIGDVEKIRVDANGNVVVAEGITLGNGTTYAAANTLDDYEEGSWTPTWIATNGSFGTIAYANRDAKYVKVGNVVHVTGEFYTTGITIGTATGELRIGGLPFTNGMAGNGVASLKGDIRLFSGEVPWAGNVNEGTNYIALYYKTSITGSSQASQVVDLATSGTGNIIGISASYYLS